MQAQLAALFASRDRDDWSAHFAGTEACVTPVLSLAEAPDHPHNQARGTFQDGLPRPAPLFDGQAAEPGPTSGLTLDQIVTKWSHHAG